ncbi:hypothetical protein OG563_00125 [Nocardia vinacea]|uniref:Uncharacterized protein n=1 Tax=Nocardia vinacea TaxID=96468 RepID=A0ABZ1YX08_9NOCA|nr:hypothetical protein [Nocardia vinacea]
MSAHQPRRPVPPEFLAQRRTTVSPNPNSWRAGLSCGEVADEPGAGQ